MTLKLITAIFTVLPFLAFNQLTEFEVRQMAKTAPESQLVVEASRMLQENYFYYSEIVVDRLLEIKPESSNYNYRKGFIILDSRQDFINALPYLQKAIVETNKNFDMYSAKETAAPTDAFYHLGRCYHLNYEFDKAEEYYNKFIEVSSKKSELIPKAELRLKQLVTARELVANPSSAIVTNIGDVVNTGGPEYAPVVSLDGQSLYFTSRRQWEDKSTDDYRDPMLYQYPEDIYVSFIDFDGTWTSPYKLEFCEGRTNEATIAVSPDERRIYAYQDISGGGDIYYSDFKKNEFQTLEQLNYRGVNTDFWETHCTVTPDGMNMYFVSDRPGGFGGRDIYRTVKLPNGTWSEPMNLGATINTEYDEESPFLAIDNKTMYFSSNGPKSMGEFDIFVTVRDENNVWSNPINLGDPINSTGDDIFYTTTVDGLKGYLTSFRKGGYGEKDIYEVQNDYMGVKNVIVLKGAIKTIDGSIIPEDAQIKLTCLDCLEGSNQEVLPRLRDGAFITSLLPCKEYEITFFENETKQIRSEIFVTSCNKAYEEIYKEAFIGNYTLAGTVADRATAEWLNDSKVVIKDSESGDVLETLYTADAGNFISNVLENKVYGDSVKLNISISKEGYLAQTFIVREKLGTSPKIELTYLLEKLEIGSDIGKIIAINPIYFDLDKSNIRPDAEIELNKIVEIMNENPAIEIELGSHTDCRASKGYNMKLSDRRAKSSAEYIRKRISNPSRIYGKGYGESQLVNDCGCEGNVESDCTEEEHQENRRTEFKIIKM